MASTLDTTMASKLPILYEDIFGTKDSGDEPPPAPLKDLVTLTQLPEMVKNFQGSPLLNSALECGKCLDRLWALKEARQRWNASERALIPLLRQNIGRLKWLCNGWLNTGHYKTVPDRIRLLYAFICAFQAKLECLCDNYLESLHCCDEGLLKGNDLEDQSLSRFASLLCRKCLPATPKIDEMKGLTNKSVCPPALSNSVQIPALELPSLDVFYNKFLLPSRPVIIRKMVNGWPAYEKWSFDFLNSVCGHRLVPVELGSKYTDEDWHQQLMTFHEYLSNFVFCSPATAVENGNEKPPGYMAQHRLLDQIPELAADVPIPDYCAFGQQEKDAEGEEEEQFTLNMFIGPAGTVSPLHTDPRHNCFCQIRGRKFVRLISPQQREALYLYGDLMRQNTSQVDVEHPDLEQFPLFATVQCHDFLMEAGDALFIPQGWFHHVRALQPSISVSIWFGLISLKRSE